MNKIIWSCVFTVQLSESHPAAIEINGKTPNFASHIRLALFHRLKQSNRYQVSSIELVWSTSKWNIFLKVKYETATSQNL